jgi:[ribosomal protein S18]-alanine N-acetyltransferase
MNTSGNTSGAEVEIRRMGTDDVPRVLEIADGLQEAPHYSEETWLRLLDPTSEPLRLALVAAESETGAVQGFAVSAFLPPRAELESIAVAAAWQRRGFGHRLLQATIDELQRAGTEEIWLEVRASNRTAIGLYRRFGFSETGRRVRYYIEPVEDAVLMSFECN